MAFPIRMIGAAALAITFQATSAAPLFHESGANLTYGPASNRDSVFLSTHNPAAGAVNLSEGADFRMGVVPNIGIGYEIGQADDFATELEDLADALDSTFTTPDQAQDTAERFNALLPTIAEEGYLRAWGVAHVPAFPLTIRTSGRLEGAVTLDISLSAEAWGGFLDDPVSVSPAGNTIESESAVHVKGAEITEFSAGYSRPVMTLGGGQLYAGGRLKYLRMALSQQVVALETVGEDEDIGEVIQDNYQENQNTSAGITLDTGITWVRDDLRAGLTLTNLTEPSFDYGTIGFNCNRHIDPARRDGCLSAQFFADRIDRDETHTMERQVTVEAAAGLLNDRLSLSAAYDLNAARDPVSAEHQYLTVAAGWEPRSFWIPGVRIGYRKNTAGEKLSMLTGGLRLLRVVAVDLAYGLETAKYEGESYPRTATVNLSVEAQF